MHRPYEGWQRHAVDAGRVGRDRPYRPYEGWLPHADTQTGRPHQVRIGPTVVRNTRQARSSGTGLPSASAQKGWQQDGLGGVSGEGHVCIGPTRADNTTPANWAEQQLRVSIGPRGLATQCSAGTSSAGRPALIGPTRADNTTPDRWMPSQRPPHRPARGLAT